MEAPEESAVTSLQAEPINNPSIHLTETDLAQHRAPTTPSIPATLPLITQARTPSKWIAQGQVYLRDLEYIKSLWPQLFQADYEDVLSAVTTYYHMDFNDVSINKRSFLEKIHAVYENDYDALYYIILCMIKFYGWRIDQILDALKKDNKGYVCKKVKELFTQINDKCEDQRKVQEMQRAIQVDHFLLVGELESLIALKDYFNIAEHAMGAEENIFIRALVKEFLPALNYESLLKENNKFLRYLAKEFIDGFSQCDSESKLLIYSLFNMQSQLDEQLMQNKLSLPPNERFFSCLFRELYQALSQPINKPLYLLLRKSLLIYVAKVGYEQAEFLLEFFSLKLARHRCNICIKINLNFLQSILEQYDAETISLTITHIESLKLTGSEAITYVKSLFVLPKPAEQDNHIKHLLNELQKIAANAPLQWRVNIVVIPLIKMIQKHSVSFAASIVPCLLFVQGEMFQRLKILDYIASNGSDGLSEFVSAMRCFDETMESLSDAAPYSNNDAWLVDKLLVNGFGEAAALLEMMAQFFVIKKPPNSPIQGTALSSNNVVVKKQLDCSSVHTSNIDLYSDFVVHIRHTYNKYGLSGISELKTILEEVEASDLFRESTACKKLLQTLCAHMYIKGFAGILKVYSDFINNWTIVLVVTRNPNNNVCELQPLSDTFSSAQLASKIGLYGRVQSSIIMPDKQKNDMQQKKQNALRYLSEENYQAMLNLINVYEKEVIDDYLKLMDSSIDHAQLPYVNLTNTLVPAKLFFLQKLKNSIESNVSDDLLGIIDHMKEVTKKEFPKDDIEQGFFSDRCYSFIQAISKEPSANAIPLPAL